MSAPPKTIAMLGLGLISGSLAKALKDSARELCVPAPRIIAWGPREKSLKEGLAQGVIDDYSLELEDTLIQSDIIVIGAPPIATGELLRDVLRSASGLPKRPVVTDLASIKGYVCTVADSDYPGFVPGHPIAGSEHSGVSAARGDLFKGREVILTPLPSTDAAALDVLTELWRTAGARVTIMSIADHDAALAASSHSPHMLAYALTMALGKNPLSPMRHGGGALRDMTRIAASDPLMWRDIALTNRDALLSALDDVVAELAQLRDWVSVGDGEALEDYFGECRALRRRHDAVLNPLITSETTKS